MDQKAKSTFEALVLPLVIAIVGVTSTYMITRSQLQSADKLAIANRESEERRAVADQHVKILEMFSDQIKSGEPAKRKMALRVLTALEPELAEKLAQAVADTDSDPDIREVANSVVRSVTPRGNTFVVIGSYSSFGEARDKLARLQAQSGGLPFTPEIYLSENHLYALTLGGHLTFAEANRRLPSAKAIAADAYLKSSDHWGDNPL
jgi:hypothetical protein